MFTFAKFCRLCLKDSDFLVNFADNDLDNISYGNKIKSIFPELVIGYKNFPQWICVLCREELNQYYTFRKKCFDSHELLKKYKDQLKFLTIENRHLHLSCDNSENSPRNDFEHSPRNDFEHSSRNDFEHSSRINSGHSPRNNSGHSLRNNSRHSPRNNSESTKNEQGFFDDTSPLNENSFGSTISITKNEIPVTEEDELNFKLFYKTIIKHEKDPNAPIQIDDNIVNNEHENINETEVEKKQQIISLGSGLLNNTVDQTTRNTSATNSEISSDKMKECSNQSNIIKDVISESSKNTLEHGAKQKPQNIKTSLEKTKESSNQSITIKNTSSGEDISEQHEAEKSPNHSSLFSDEHDNDSETSSEETNLLSRLSLRKKRRTSVSYNKRSDREDFSGDDNSESKPEKVVASKKPKYTSKNKNISDPAKTVVSNTTGKNLNLKKLTKTDSQIDLKENYKKFKIFTSNNVSKVILIEKSKCTNIAPTDLSSDNPTISY